MQPRQPKAVPQTQLKACMKWFHTPSRLMFAFSLTQYHATAQREVGYTLTQVPSWEILLQEGGEAAAIAITFPTSCGWKGKDDKRAHERQMIERRTASSRILSTPQMHPRLSFLDGRGSIDVCEWHLSKWLILELA